MAQKPAAAAVTPLRKQLLVSDAAAAGRAYHPRRAAAADGAGCAPIVGAGSAAIVLAVRGEGTVGAVLASLQPTNSLLSESRLHSWRWK